MFTTIPYRPTILSFAAVLMAALLFCPLAVSDPSATPTAAADDHTTALRAGEFDYFISYGAWSFYISTFQASWPEMEQRCVNTGGHLASIAGAEENEIVQAASVIREGTDLWIGYTDQFDEGNWVWTDETPAGYENWTNDGETVEPDNANGDQHYALVRGTSYPIPAHIGTWADEPEYLPRFGVLKLIKPDLRPIEFFVEPAAPTTNDVVSIHVVWTNAGGPALNQTCRQFWLDGELNGDWCTDDIPAGAANVQLVWEGPLPAGDHVVMAIADVLDQQVELDEENNVLEFGFHVGTPAPAEVETASLGPNDVQLNWGPVDPAAVSIQVERKEGLHGEWELMDTLANSATSWLDASVTAGTNYYYRLRTWDGVQLSGPSNYTTAEPGFLPAAPSGISAAVLSPIKVRVTWQDNADNELGYLIERKTGEFGTWQQTWPLYAGTTLYDDNLVWPEADYQYRVRSYNKHGKSAYATTTVVSTPTDPGNFDAAVIVKHGITPCGFATVYVDHRDGNGFTSVGNTDYNGYLNLTGLSLKDRIRATWTPNLWKNCRAYTSDSSYHMGIRLIMDTDTGPTAQGNYTSYQIASIQTLYELQCRHPVFVYDMAISIGKNLSASDPYWGQLHQACQQASDYLYDVSDGQLAFNRFLVYDNWLKWKYVDVQVKQGNFTAHTQTNQYDDCDKHSEDEHIHIPGASGATPNTTGWPRTLVHEFGHYALNLKDEYETGSGGQAMMEQLKNADPANYPQNYGFMDSESQNAEMSSKNDYLKNYDYGCNPYPVLMDWCGWIVSEQLYARGKSCWDQVESKLEGMSSLVNIVKPPHGWFSNSVSSSADRTGPAAWWGDVVSEPINGVPDPKSEKDYPPIQFEIIDSGGPVTAISTDMIVRDGELPAAKARIYRLGNRGLEWLGTTDDQGVLRGAAFEPGDELRSYSRRRDGTVRDVIPSQSAKATGAVVEFSASRPEDRTWGKADVIDTEAPGAAVDVMPFGSLEEPVLVLRIWPDESLAEDPLVVAFHGTRVDTLPGAWDPGDGHFETELGIDLSDPVFDGTGVFEIGLLDDASNLSLFTVDFELHEVFAGTDPEFAHGTAVLNVPLGEVVADQFAVSAWSNSLPYRTDAGLMPVSNMFAVHLALDDVFATPTSVNVVYGDSLLTGFDETSLGLYQWNADGAAWALTDNSLVSPPGNVVTGLAGGGGTYAVFASVLVGDEAPPGAIEDLGAVVAPDAGALQLFWTASGDDGGVGAAQQYILAYSEAPFDAEAWPELQKITLAVTPAPAGAQQTTTVILPRPGRLFYLGLRAKDDASLLSPVSNITYTVTGTGDANYLPGPPTDFRAVDMPADVGAAVGLSWQLSRDDGGGKATVEGYQVYRATGGEPVPELVATLPAGVDGWADETAALGEPYTYYVGAVDSTGETMAPGNRAFSAINLDMPVGDFTSDAIIGLDDLGHLTDHYGLGLADAEYDPLFDLDVDAEIYQSDVDILANFYAMGGLPAADPPGENGAAVVFYELSQDKQNVWHVILGIEGASNLAGFCFRVIHDPAADLTVAGPGDGADDPGFLTSQQGWTPVFMVAERGGDRAWVGQSIQRATEQSAPDGGGVLAHLEFVAEGSPHITVDNVVLMDHAKRLNHHGRPAEVRDGVPSWAYLLQNSPNPFNPRTDFHFATTRRGPVSLRVYDLRGRLVHTVVEQVLVAGRHEFAWDGRDGRGRAVASGVYLYRLESPGFEQSRKLVLLR